MKALTHIIRIILPFLFKKEVTKKVIPPPTFYGLKGAIVDPLSFISEYFGDMYSVYLITGLKSEPKKAYRLFQWLDACEQVIKERGFITGFQIIQIGVAFDYIEHNPANKDHKVSIIYHPSRDVKSNINQIVMNLFKLRTMNAQHA